MSKSISKPRRWHARLTCAIRGRHKASVLSTIMYTACAASAQTRLTIMSSGTTHWLTSGSYSKSATRNIRSPCRAYRSRNDTSTLSVKLAMMERMHLRRLTTSISWTLFSYQKAGNQSLSPTLSISLDASTVSYHLLITIIKSKATSRRSLSSVGSGGMEMTSSRGRPFWDWIMKTSLILHSPNLKHREQNQWPRT